MRRVFLLFIVHSNMAFSAKSLPEMIDIGSTEYSLCKQHTIKYALLIKVVEVGLYLQDCNLDQEILYIEDKLIRFHYKVNVKAKVFIEAAEESFLKNFPHEISLQELSELKQFNSFYQNISDNDFYDLHHKNGKELLLYKNNKVIGKSNYSIFSFRYFNIWFGKFPAIKSLKKSFT